jgi:hypothetical protein
MSQENTHRTQQLILVETFVANFKAAERQLDKLDCDTLSEDAVDNLKRVFGEARNYVEILQESTYKLLD